MLSISVTFHRSLSLGRADPSSALPALDYSATFPSMHLSTHTALLLRPVAMTSPTPPPCGSCRHGYRGGCRGVGGTVNDSNDWNSSLHCVETRRHHVVRLLVTGTSAVMLCDSLVVMVTQYKIDILTFPAPLAFLSLFCNTVNILNKIRLLQHYLLCSGINFKRNTGEKKKTTQTNLKTCCIKASLFEN